MRKVSVGFLGCGNIGCGVWKLLNEFQADILHRADVEFDVKRILVRDVKKKRDQEVPAELLTTDPAQVTDDPGIEMVLEFMGGETPATQYMLRALEMGKTVVTANKMALALNWHILQAAAEKHGSGLYYEAAVCGAIPIIRTTLDSLMSNRIEEMMGIVNGTTNYILTRMSQEGSDYGEVLVMDWGMATYHPDYDHSPTKLDLDRGIAAVGHDHLGHGESVINERDLGFFADGDASESVIRDMRAVTLEAKRHFPGLPVFLLGHSMGSFFVRRYLPLYGGAIAGAVLLGTGWFPLPVTRGGCALARTICALLVLRVRPTIMPRAYWFQYGAPMPVKAGTM